MGKEGLKFENQDILNQELKQKIIEGLKEFLPDKGEIATLEERFVEGYKNYLDPGGLPDETAEEQIQSIPRYLEWSRDYAFQWVVFDPRVSKGHAEALKKEILEKLRELTQTSVVAGEILQSEGLRLFDRFVSFAENRNANNPKSLIIVDGVDQLSARELGKMMFDLYLWPDMPTNRLHAKILMYLPPEVDFALWNVEAGMGHKGGIRNTLDRARHQVIYEKKDRKVV